MRSLPRAVLGAGAAAAIYFPVHDYLEPTDGEIAAVERVNACAAALGEQAVRANELAETCAQYSANFIPSDVTGKTNGQRHIVYKLPSAFELIKKELPAAALQDQQQASKNAENAAYAHGLAAFIGLIGGLAVHSSKKLKEFTPPTLRRRKKESTDQSPVTA